MCDASCQLFLAALISATATRWVVWVGLVLLTVSLIALTRTAWGQSHPLRKCIFLSLIAHLLLAIYLTTINIVSIGGGAGDGGTIEVALWDAPLGDTSLGDPNATEIPAGDVQAKPAVQGVADKQPTDKVETPKPVAPPTSVPQIVPRQEPKPEPQKQSVPPVEPPKPTEPTKQVPAADVPPPPQQDTSEDNKLVEVTRTATGTPAKSAADAAKPNQQTVAPKVNSQPTGADAVSIGSSARGSASNASGSAVAGTNSPLSGTAPAGTVPPGSTTGVPGPLQLRLAGDHGTGIGYGGSQDTEAAVAAALAWLAGSQTTDGRWDASQFGAGREVMVNGQDRRGAGSQADTGITGLALLAFLASGETHLQGKYKPTVQRGLEFLMQSQAVDGNLGGNATLYEKTYCHAMAMFALSEALAMTHDLRLEQPVRRAVAYSLAVQDPSGGGWRYQPRDQGDTSQLGWQVMALKSAELSGIPIPQQTRDLIERFLKSVTSGQSGGLAAYRPGHAPSRPMTAEALVCRQFLGNPISPAAAQEAADFVIGEKPGTSQANVYYWYYASLAMFQLQDRHWRAWNEALQTTLLRSQRTSGPTAGSWDPDDAWGAYGGRVYATALSALCLEVYYRYLPLQVDAASRSKSRQ